MKSEKEQLEQIKKNYGVSIYCWKVRYDRCRKVFYVQHRDGRRLEDFKKFKDARHFCMTNVMGKRMEKKKVMTRKEYEDKLNEIYTPDEARDVGEYMLPKASSYLSKGRYGSALRRFDKTMFEVGYSEEIRKLI